MDLFGIAGHQVVGQIDGHLGAAHFGGVEAHALDRNGLAAADQRVDLFLRQAAGIGQTHAGLPDLLQVLMILRRSNDDFQEGVALGAGAHICDGDAVRLRFQQIEIFNDLIPSGQLVIGARLEPEMLFGCGDLAHKRVPSF